MGEFALRFVVALWHVAGILLLLLLFVEYGVEGLRRLSRRMRHGRAAPVDRSARADAYHGADWALPYFEEFSRRVRTDWKPYVGWWQRPFRGTYVTIDERGLRATPGEHDAAPGAVCIWCLGGSTMMGMGVRDEHTIAAALARRLGESGYRVAVTNMGQLAHNSTQETISLHQALKEGGRPDIVVFYDGVNDMMAAEQTGFPDRMFHEASRRAEFNLLYPDRRRDLVAATLIALFPRTVRRLRSLTGLELHGPLPGPPPALAEANIPNLAARTVAAYAANQRLVRLLAESYGFRPLFFWQPVLATKRHKSVDEKYFASQFTVDPAARLRLYEAVIAARRDLPEAADSIDLSGLFDDTAEPLYIDFYHLSEPGNAAVAEAMLPTLAAAVAQAKHH